MTRVTLNTLVHLLRNIPEHTLTKLSFLVMIDVPKSDIGAKIPGILVKENVWAIVLFS